MALRRHVLPTVGRQLRRCSQSGTGTGKSELASGALMNKGSRPGDATGKDETQREMWFVKDSQKAFDPYVVDNGGDKGLPYTGEDVFEFQDPSPDPDIDGVTEARVSVLSPERRAKQEALLKQAHGRRALSNLLGVEEGSLRVEKQGSIVIVEVMGAHEKLTGGMLHQFSDLLIQIHNMHDVTGVIFHIIGSLKGLPQHDNGLSQAVVHEAAAGAQRVSVDLLHVQPLTACVFSKELSGVGLELMSHCDFLFASPRAKVKLSNTAKKQCTMMGGLSQIGYRISPRKALMLAGRGQALTADVAEEVGLVDQVMDRPLDAAKRFLNSIPEENWQTIRKMKDVTTTSELMGMKEGFIREQYHFRYTWCSTAHLSACSDIQKAM